MTGDADLSLEFCVLASSRLIDELRADGYQLVARNRLERDGGTRAIDVLVPADIFRVRHNRAVGELFVDEAPGLRYTLSRAPLILELQVRLTSLEARRAARRNSRPNCALQISDSSSSRSGGVPGGGSPCQATEP